MSSSTDKLKTRLATLNLSLEELEAQLDPLLAQTLPETVVNLDPVQQAKLHVLLPYLVHGLLFGAQLFRLQVQDYDGLSTAQYI
jgi:exosome complex protein LRP1